MKAIGHILLAVVLGLGALVQATDTATSPAVLLQEALYQEQTAGDLDKAIELYGQVLEQAAEVERLAARATYQLGLCYLKKGDEDTAADYFQKAVSSYPGQTSVVKKAQAQLDKIAPTVPEGILFEKLPQDVLLAIGNMYGQTCAKAGLKNLYTNSNIHYVDSDYVCYSGGYGYYTNRLNIPLTQKVRLSGTSYPNQTHYDISGRKMNTEIVPDEERPNFYHIYWTPSEPLPPGQIYMYGWCGRNAKILPMTPNAAVDDSTTKRAMTMQNYFGNHAFEVFYLVLPAGLYIADAAEPYTDKQTVGDFTIYAWEKEIQSNENHVVTVYLSKKKDVSPEELKAIVEKAVLTISTCAETDPRVKGSLETLQSLDGQRVLSELSSYFDSGTATIRRSAIYIAWKGSFSDISPIEQKLLELCSHSENYTRGMAALALGQYKVAAAYDTLADMTLHDEDAYVRRCAAYALGLLGDPQALPVLEQALEDPEALVKNNAQAAIAMLTNSATEQSEPDPAYTQEMYNDIQPDGTIRFWGPQQLTNNGAEPITETRFINSDFVELTAMTDEGGNPIDFTITHDGNIYRYHVIFDPPIMPGQTLVYTSEGTITGLVKPVMNETDTYRYYMTHSPATGVPTLRIEEYVLPEGAQLLSTLSEDMQQSERDGRIVLRVEKIIPAGGSITTSFKYRLTQ